MRIYLSTVIILFLLSILFLFPVPAAAQIADLKTTVALKEAIVTYFNQGDYKKIYQLADDRFRREVPEEAFTRFLERQIAPLGKIASSPLVDDMGEANYFRLNFDGAGGKSLRLALGARSLTEFYLFGIEIIRPDRPRPPRSDNPRRRPIDTIVDRAAGNYFKDLSAVGLSIGVVRDGKFFTYNYGEVEKGSGRLPAADSFYEIGSITKTFTGTLLARAVTDGKVKLDDDIRQYMDGEYSNLQFQSHPVTLRDLATHTSGIPSSTDNVKDDPPANPWENFSKDQLMDGLHRVKLTRKPGEHFEYSNSAVGLLGNILEKVYGLPYESLVQKYVASPAGMAATKIDLSDSEKSRFVRGHDREGKVVGHWRVRGIEAAGALRSTVADMLKYASFNLSARHKPVRLAQDVHWQSSVVSARIGLGWEIQTTPSGFRRLAHSGGTGGFRSYMAIYPKLRLGIVVLSNSAEADPSRVADEIYFRATKNGSRP